MPESPKPSWIPIAQVLQRHSGAWKAIPPRALLPAGAEFPLKAAAVQADLGGSDRGAAGDLGSVTRTAIFQQSQNIPK